jgi:phosphoenolpyruvate carboxykinase (ATP)
MEHTSANIFNQKINDFISDHQFPKFINLDKETLTQHTLNIGEGELSDTRALCIKTGKFTGRSPKDRFIVIDEKTKSTVDWGEVNKPFGNEDFENLENEMLLFLKDKALYVQNGYAGANKNYSLNVRLIAEKPWSAHFFDNMFLNYNQEGVKHIKADWTILCVPSFLANPEIHNTRQENFAIINFTKQAIIIGGTGYTGEIKKAIFSVLNYLLPTENEILPMHCSANEGKDGDVAIYFGLSGTGKTTLSADVKRSLIGDDEHGWADDGIFNFEGGCYAKCIGLSEDKEPDIYHAIKQGAILENIVFKEGTNIPDFNDKSITENTRVSYPLDHIKNAKTPSKGGIPKNIFFLTCDAFGVLPPISRLTPGQAMFHFLSGYTAKVAGTEAGITEPVATFSTCFGAPFLPLHPAKYAEMLGDKIKSQNVKIWLVNTGWSGGPYGIGERINLNYTRAMINAALNGDLDYVEYDRVPVFHLHVPKECPGVPSEILKPRNTWKNKDKYDFKATHLAGLFNHNFKKYESEVTQEIKATAPRLMLLL